MTEKELKKLSRRQLRETLTEQIKRTEELEAKAAAAERQLAEARRQLADRRITAEKPGSMAEAAIKVNGVFEAAEAAAKQYLDNIAVYSEKCDRIVEDARQKSTAVREQARQKLTELIDELTRVNAEWDLPE